MYDAINKEEIYMSLLYYQKFIVVEKMIDLSNIQWMFLFILTDNKYFTDNILGKYYKFIFDGTID